MLSISENVLKCKLQANTMVCITGPLYQTYISTFAITSSCIIGSTLLPTCPKAGVCHCKGDANGIPAHTAGPLGLRPLPTAVTGRDGSIEGNPRRAPDQSFAVEGFGFGCLGFTQGSRARRRRLFNRHYEQQSQQVRTKLERPFSALDNTGWMLRMSDAFALRRCDRFGRAGAQVYYEKCNIT